MDTTWTYGWTIPLESIITEQWASVKCSRATDVLDSCSADFTADISTNVAENLAIYQELKPGATEEEFTKLAL